MLAILSPKPEYRNGTCVMPFNVPTQADSAKESLLLCESMPNPVVYREALTPKKFC